LTRLNYCLSLLVILSKILEMVDVETPNDRAASANKRRRMKFYYVYILQSEIDHERFYAGFTEDLDSRLKTHNSVLFASAGGLAKVDSQV
jgi:predicted GIY-YIG superfamily endonuclease